MESLTPNRTVGDVTLYCFLGACGEACVIMGYRVAPTHEKAAAIAVYCMGTAIVLTSPFCLELATSFFVLNLKRRGVGSIGRSILTCT